MKRILLVAKFSLFLFLAFAFSASAYYNPGNPTGFVNDYAEILKVEQRQSLEEKLSQFEKDSGNEISVVTIPSLQGDTIENFATELFEQWGIGKKDKDNGVLVLIALEDRKMRIEVGYGLEGVLTDAQASRIINNTIKPAFQKNNYYQGIDEAVDKIMSVTKGEEDFANTINAGDEAGEKSFADRIGEIIGGLIFSIYFLYYAFLFVLLILTVFGRTRSWYWGGICGFIIGSMAFLAEFSLKDGLKWAIIFAVSGLLLDFLLSLFSKFWQKVWQWFRSKNSGSGRGSGGGFGGFGGGSSGGGGASGSW